MNQRALFSYGIAAVCLLSLNACSMLNELTQRFNPSATVASVKVPEHWSTPLPHGGQISQLSEFWQRYPNPILLELILAAQTQAPDVATAAANMAEARANRIKAQAELLPKLDGTFTATRSLQQAGNMGSGNAMGNNASFGFLGGNTPLNNLQGSLQASWELDLYGTQRVLRDATQAQERAAGARWHEARVSVAAEVATSYFNYLLCRQQSKLATEIAQSHQESVRLSEIRFKAGFSDAGAHALALAEWADARQQAKYQATQCELEVKNLVALTYLEESQMREKLATAEHSTPTLDLNKLFIIEEVPANAIRQRPDVYYKEVELWRAAANVQQAAADRLPSISLSGSIGWMRLSSETFKSQGRVWSLGPVSLSLPLFDGGHLKATQETAEARYAEAAAVYRGAVQKAVKETELALVNLHDTEERQHDIAEHLERLQQHFSLTNTREQNGLASHSDVEEARRGWLQIQKSALTIQQARALAWLNLYRAAGGGWQPNQATPADASSSL